MDFAMEKTKLAPLKISKKENSEKLKGEANF